jgi:hypothetical protein
MILLFALFTGTLGAQEFDKHRWKDRLLVIYTNDINKDEVRKQLDWLAKARKELNDRKLKIYVVSEEKFWYNFSQNGQPLEKKMKRNKPFEIVLIGLDGGDKFGSEEVQSVQAINALIDGMPMRQNELKNRNKG